MSSGWHSALAISHSDDVIWTLNHPDDMPVSHPDHLTGVGISSSFGWHTPPSYVIQLTQLKLVSYPGEFRQCYYVIRMRYASFLKSSGWDNKFWFFTTRDGPSALPYIATCVTTPVETLQIKKNVTCHADAGQTAHVTTGFQFHWFY